MDGNLYFYFSIEFWQPIWQRDDDQPYMDFPVLRHFTKHPEIAISMTDMELWTQAIRRLKSGSARGIDGVSIQELKMLPTYLIQTLAKILSHMGSGFDESFMMGLTCPLSNTAQVPRKDQTRPITILCQIYRVWSAVACRQITRHLSTAIPKDVTGLLPHRGSADTAYCMQFQLERAKLSACPRSGLTLDIRKCFNNMHWNFVFAILDLLGVPRHLLCMWFRSLCRLDRKWLITGQLHDGGWGSTGLPEGDVWAVVAMIGVAYCWISFLRHCSHQQGFCNSELFLSAYADNWAWAVSQPQHHRVLLQATLDFLAAAGLEIDTAKTWFWTVLAPQAEPIRDVLSSVMPGVVIQHKSTTDDLGFQLHYSGGFRRGIRQQRVDKGLQRLQRIKVMPHDLCTKAKLIRVSVYPAALYGIAVRPPSLDTLDRLRSLAAQALIGHSTNMSAAVALLVAPQGNLDPEFWTWCAIFKIARAFLLTAQPADKNAFLAIASQFTGQLANVQGPATALGHVLCQIGWFIDSQGFVSIDGFRKLDICANSFQRFKRLMQHSWQEQLVMHRTQRKRWFRFPDINMQATRAALNRFNPRQQRKLIWEASGAYQTHVQKSKWVDGNDGTCPYCDEQDTKEHMLLRCPVGFQVREPYQPLIDWIQESGSAFPEFPFVTVHPLLSAAQYSFFALDVPPLPQCALDFAHDRMLQGCPVHWFTDGACASCPAGDFSYSAFAIVLDLCVSDLDREWQAHMSYTTHEVPSTLSKVMVCRTPGEQDILRVEMFAAAMVLLQAKFGTVHVDNTTAVVLLNLALNTDDLAALVHRDHFDILLQVWQHRDAIHCNVVKLEAHKYKQDNLPALTRYWRWGNFLADEIAVSAREKILPQLVSEIRQLQTDVMEQMDKLFATYQLQLELQVVRAKANAALNTDGVADQLSSQDIVSAYEQWVVVSYASLEGEFDKTFFHLSAFGARFMDATLAWIHQLRWPSDGSLKGPLGFHTSVSWVELGLCWMIFVGTYIPVLREDATGARRLLHCISFDQAKDAQLTLSEGGTMLQKIWDNLASVLPQKLHNPGRRTKVSSLYHLGSQKYVQGWSVRYEFPHQREVLKLVRTAITGGHCFWHYTPDLTAFLARDQVKETFPLDYDELQRRCRNGQHQIRKHRKTLGLWDFSSWSRFTQTALDMRRMECAVLAFAGTVHLENQGNRNDFDWIPNP